MGINAPTGVAPGRRVTAIPTPPAASSVAARRVMQGNRKRDTGPEIRFRRAFFAAGFRYRVNYELRGEDGQSVRADLVFPRRKVAVFIDGCFWHRCPTHGTRPRSNSAYWDAKLAANEMRDVRTTASLESSGWVVLRLWEHETSSQGLDRLHVALGDQRGLLPGKRLSKVTGL